MKSRTHSVIVAGGTGTRFDGTLPKQFLEIHDKPLLFWTAAAFLKEPSLCSLVIVSHADWMERCDAILKDLNDHRSDVAMRCIAGGEQRQDSSRNGVKNLDSSPDDVVLIHDAARPAIDDGLIQRIIRAASLTGAAIPVIPQADSMIRFENGIALDYPDRSKFRRVQTPQGFKYRIILDAHESALQAGFNNAPDDGCLAIQAGYPVAAVDGGLKNLKVTRKEDLEVIRIFLKA